MAAAARQRRGSGAVVVVVRWWWWWWWRRGRRVWAPHACGPKGVALGRRLTLSSLTNTKQAFLISGAPFTRTASLSALLASLSSSTVTVISRSS